MQTVTPNTKIAWIACGVLALDCKHLICQSRQDVELHFLPGGLHKSPAMLRAHLQEAIDQIDQRQTVSRIVIGYGLCGHGTSGLQARTLPLIIPRVHDCIALFLGSDAAYRGQFAKAPGTYYMSAGWVEDSQAGHPSGMGSVNAGPQSETDPTELTERFGADNAHFIQDFMQSWARNYTRSAFIDTGVGGTKEHYARQAQDLAQKHGWQFERIPGTHDLLSEALQCSQTTEHMLYVPPGSITTYDAMQGKLTCTTTSSHREQPTPGKAPVSSDIPSIPDTEPAQRGIGIGIDAGGTYTDAVLYDFDSQTVLAKNKARTTHWDYSHGIREALAGLDPNLCRKAALVSVSTTLATNALVEGRGQPVGLLVMPPCGWTTLDGFQHEPTATIKGQMAIDGSEREPVERDDVITVARRLIEQQGVTAFAVGGYAAHVNPAHEQLVKQIVQQETDLICTCSHELSNSLHYRIRAETAALNARIIPCLEELLQRITDALTATGIHAPVMVVRSDGSLMSLPAACERPLETMLSGPAASAAGAGWLAGVSDGLVVDVGGTTTDTAILQNGTVAMNPEGASIGGWQTHIKALDLHTAGLGGDSAIRFKNGTFQFGPDRWIPLAWAARNIPGMPAALETCTKTAIAHHPELNAWSLLVRTRKQAPENCSPREKQILAALENAPRAPGDLAQAIQVPHPALLPLEKLLQQQLIAYTGFTPTDALHVTGELEKWDAATVLHIARVCAGPQCAPDEWARSILDRFRQQLAIELARKCISVSLPDLEHDTKNISPLLDHLVKASHASRLPSLQLAMPWPVIGIGAPAHAFVPMACRHIQAQCIIPPHADVANAVGAIIGTISVNHTLAISRTENGIFRIAGAPDAPPFNTIEDATDWCIRFLHQRLQQKAAAAGCQNPHITIKPQDSLSTANDGSPIFIERKILGHANGLPA